MSASIIQTDVTAFAPELATGPRALQPGAWTDILAYVNEMDMTVQTIGESAQVDRMAKIYLAAHLGAVSQRASSGAAGPVTGESSGGLRRSFGLISSVEGGYLSTTFYGQQYLAIIGLSLAHGPFVC